MTFQLVDDTPRSPQWVECTGGHRWIGMYLPMLATDAARVMSKLCCPMCSADARKVFPINPPQEGSTNNNGESPCS